MTQQPVADCARVVIKWSMAGQDFSNVLHYVKSGYNSTEQAALAAAVAGAANSFTTGSLSQDVHYDGTDAYDIRSGTGPITPNTAGQANGGVAEDAIPINTAIVTTLYSAARGRSGRGRIYHAGYGEGSIVDGIYVAGAKTSAEAFVTNLKDNASAIGWTMVIVSRFQNHVELPNPITYPVLTFQVRSLLPGTQRRRVDRP